MSMAASKDTQGSNSALGTTFFSASAAALSRSPVKPVSDSTRASQQKNQIEAALIPELHENVLEVTTESFFLAFLPSVAVEDEVVEACLPALQEYGPLLDAARQETDLYSPLAELLNLIGDQCRQRRGSEADKEWPRATPPCPAPSPPAATPPSPAGSPSTPHSSTSSQYLHRRFYVTHRNYPRYHFTKFKDSPICPDMVLLLVPSDDVPTLLQDVAWTDIKLAIEVKFDSDNPLLQIARYVRCIKQEQHDRKFIFTLTFTKTSCRVARWDPSACYITPEIHFHDTTFIRLITRLTSMNPREFGYDEQFSNAGRVLARDLPITTTLTIQPRHMEEGLDHVCEPHGPALRYLLDSKLLCRTRDGLFSRSTRVWKATLIDEAGSHKATHAIKENWQDEARVNEAWFYNKTEHIQNGVAHMLYFDDVDRTGRFGQSLDVVAVWKQKKTSKGGVVLARKELEPGERPSDRLCHRVLLRIVLKEVGRPLSEAVGSQQLLQVAHDITRALQAIYQAGVLHRDISYGNILLQSEEGGREGNAAFIVDFGLALRVDPDSGNVSPLDNEPHHHLTGTLPYMALDILHNVVAATTPRAPPPRDARVDHDLESLFWVLLHVAIRYAEKAPLDTDSWGGNLVQHLLEGTPRDVLSYKQLVLTSPQDISLTGQFESFQSFLVSFAEKLSEHRKSRSISPSASTDLFEHMAAGAQTELKKLQIKPSYVSPSVSKPPSTLSSKTPPTSQKRPSDHLPKPDSKDGSNGLDDSKERDRKRLRQDASDA